jgi:RNA polymerase sigma-70 factor (ECF subfamily)
MYALAALDHTILAFPGRRAPRRFMTRQLADDAASLIGAIRENADRQAFMRLFEHFAPRVKAYALRLGAATDLADEIAQETMLTVWRKAALFDPARATASAWIFAIARNLRVDAVRRARFVTYESEIPETESPEPGADMLIGAAELAGRLHLALAALPPEQSEVIRLSFFDDRPHAEIEHALGIPLGTVKSRLRLAMAKLRSLLDDCL